jgi:hypothetical protein
VKRNSSTWSWTALMAAKDVFKMYWSDPMCVCSEILWLGATVFFCRRCRYFFDFHDLEAAQFLALRIMVIRIVDGSSKCSPGNHQISCRMAFPVFCLTSPTIVVRRNSRIYT